MIVCRTVFHRAQQRRHPEPSLELTDIKIMIGPGRQRKGRRCSWLATEPEDWKCKNGLDF